MCEWNDYRVVVKSITFAITNRITIPRQSIAQSLLMTSLVAVDGSGLSRCSFTDNSASLHQDDRSVTSLHHVFGWSQKTVETATVLTILASSFNNNKEREKVSSTYHFSIDKPSVVLYTAVFQKKKCSGYVKIYTYSQSPQLFALFGNISSV